jgi:hypothetical protein
MRKPDIEELLDSVRGWPVDRQERAVEVLIALENEEANTDWLEDEVTTSVGE